MTSMLCVFVCSNSRRGCRSAGLCAVSVTGSASCWQSSYPPASWHLPGVSWPWTTRRGTTVDSSAPVTTPTSISRWRSFWWCTSSTWSSAGTADWGLNWTTESTPAPSTSWYDISPTPRRSSGGEPSAIITSVELARSHATATATLFLRHR